MPVIGMVLEETSDEDSGENPGEDSTLQSGDSSSLTLELASSEDKMETKLTLPVAEKHLE